jgi:hypothetical protein
MRCAILLCALMAFACGGSDTVAPESPVTASVVVTSARPVLVPGDSVVLTAEAFDAAGRPVLGKTPSWSSSNPSAITVSNTGIARAIAEGDATITAMIDGRGGSVAMGVRNVILEEARRVATPVGLDGDTLIVSSADGVT